MTHYPPQTIDIWESLEKIEEFKNKYIYYPKSGSPIEINKHIKHPTMTVRLKPNYSKGNVILIYSKWYCYIGIVHSVKDQYIYVQTRVHLTPAGQSYEKFDRTNPLIFIEKLSDQL